MPERQHRRVLALDFDGVICDSEREVTTVAVNAYEVCNPGAGVVQTLRNSPPDHPMHKRFADLIPLGNRAEDFGVALQSLEEDRALPDQDAYDAFYAQQSTRWLGEYHSCFYQQRNKLRQADPDAWINLHRAYDRFTQILRDRPSHVTLAIATAKDRESVVLLLKQFGLADLVPSRLLLDKETGANKCAHLEVLARELRVAYEQMTFVDDKLNHLVAVSPLGVRAVLAGWGFNTEREQALAATLGFAVAHLDDAYHVLFDPAD